MLLPVGVPAAPPWEADLEGVPQLRQEEDQAGLLSEAVPGELPQEVGQQEGRLRGVVPEEAQLLVVEARGEPYAGEGRVAQLQEEALKAPCQAEVQGEGGQPSEEVQAGLRLAEVQEEALKSYCRDILMHASQTK
jgi:hypothetical protein